MKIGSRSSSKRLSKRLRWVSLFVIVISILTIVSLPRDATVNAAPKALFTYSPEDPEVEENIIFDASGSFGNDLSYHWDFGDGHKAEGMIVNFSYGAEGNYIVVLTVVDAENELSVETKMVKVRNEITPVPPIFGIGFTLVFFIFYFSLLIIIFVFFPANIILGGILIYKSYQKAKEMNRMEEAKPYLVAFIISLAVSMFMGYFAVFSVIAHIVIYRKLNSRLKELGRGPPPRMRFY